MLDKSRYAVVQYLLHDNMKVPRMSSGERVTAAGSEITGLWENKEA
jgi:hypothetical protein